MKFDGVVINLFFHTTTIGILGLMSMVEEISLALRFLFSRRHPKPIQVKLRSQTRQPLDRREFGHRLQNQYLHNLKVVICEIIFLQREISLAC